MKSSNSRNIISIMEVKGYDKNANPLHGVILIAIDDNGDMVHVGMRRLDVGKCVMGPDMDTTMDTHHF